MLLNLDVLDFALLEIVVEHVAIFCTADDILTVWGNAKLDVVGGDLEFFALERMKKLPLPDIPYFKDRVL